MGLCWLGNRPYFLHDWPFKAIWLKGKCSKWRRQHLPHTRRLFLPEPSLFLYRIPLMFRHLTGSSLSYTDGSQLYLVPVFSWTVAKGVGGDCGPLGKKKKKRKKVTATKRHSDNTFTCSLAEPNAFCGQHATKNLCATGARCKPEPWVCPANLKKYDTR